ncbi:MAG: hypothetical protein ACTHM1_09630 [Solirubrobacteraceae bacterium]
MSFAVIDMDGSTVDTFDDAGQMLAFLSNLRQQSATAIEDLGVVEYRAGGRVGLPRPASDLVEKFDLSQIKGAVALTHSDIRVENILLSPQPAEPVLIDIAMRPEDLEAEPWDAIQRSDSHVYSLAA